MKLAVQRAASLLLTGVLLLTMAPAAFAAPSEPQRDGYRATPFETDYLLTAAPSQAAERSYPRQYQLTQEKIALLPAHTGRWNTGWASAVLRSAEASLFSGENLPDDPLLEAGFSSRHLAYFAYEAGSNSADPADVTGQAAYLLPQQDPAGRFLTAGNYFIAAAALARGSGPQYAATAPDPAPWMFDPAAVTGNLLYTEYEDFASIPGEYRFSDSYRLADMSLLPLYGPDGQPDGRAVKRALLEGLLPVLRLRSDTQGQTGRLLDSGEAYYLAELSDQPEEQMMLVVGWNDDLPASYFAADDRPLPPGPGGWLVCSADQEEPSLLWVSYYSAGLSDTAVFTLEPAAYDHNYQYDALGATALFRGGSTIAMANLFVATGEEQLESVGFYTADHEVTATIQIYTDFAHDADPTTGTPCLGRGQTQMIRYAGYHTIRLDRPVELSAEQRFAVVVTLSGSEPLHFFVERAVDGYADTKPLPGRSVIRMGQSWIDLSQTDYPAVLCIKAFTADIGSEAGEGPASLLPVTPSGMQALRPLGGEEARELAVAAFEEAAAAAASQGMSETVAPVRLVNYTDLLPEARDAILEAAQEVSQRTGISIRPWVAADTIQNNRLLGRISFDPAGCTVPLRLGAYPDDTRVQAIFDQHFANPVRVVRLYHRGEFGAPVQAMLSADLVGLLTDRLIFYHYDPETNRYRAAEDLPYQISEHGYLQLTLSEGGYYIVADRTLDPAE